MCVHMAFGLFSSVRFASSFLFYLRIWFRLLVIGFTELQYVCLNVGDLASGHVYLFW